MHKHFQSSKQPRCTQRMQQSTRVLQRSCRGILHHQLGSATGSQIAGQHRPAGWFHSSHDHNRQLAARMSGHVMQLSRMQPPYTEEARCRAGRVGIASMPSWTLAEAEVVLGSLHMAERQTISTRLSARAGRGGGGHLRLSNYKWAQVMITDGTRDGQHTHDALAIPPHDLTARSLHPCLQTPTPHNDYCPNSQAGLL